MSLIDGRYKGRVLRTDIETTKNGSVQLIATCQLEDRPDGTKFEGHFEWSAFLNLVKTNGATNDRQIASLRTALGWDGNPASLVGEGQFSEREVEFVIENETDDNGVARARIKWINAPGGGGIRREVDPDKRAAALDMLTAAMGALPLPAKPKAKAKLLEGPSEADMPF